MYTYVCIYVNREIDRGRERSRVRFILRNWITRSWEVDKSQL